MNNYPKINYIGNKEKLVDWIIDSMPIKNGKVLDLFAGGCSVSYGLKEKGYEVISNDVLYSNYVIAKAIIENEKVVINLKNIFDKLDIDNKLIISNNEKISFLGNRLYFDYEIEELSKMMVLENTLTGYEKYMFLALLRRAMIRKLPYSRMNVAWNQIQKLRNEEYSYAKYGRKRAYHNKTFEYHMMENEKPYNVAINKNKPCVAYQCCALEVIDKIEFVDVVYIDPPYPGTMNDYDAFYGLFDDMFGKRISHLDFSKKENFIENMEKLIKKIVPKTKYVVLSLNEKSTRIYINKIKEILNKYGEVEIKEKQHNYQITGKEEKNNNNELLFVLNIKN